MDRIIAMSAEERRQLCEQTAAKLGLPSGSVEKDFWVYWTLRELFNLGEWSGRLTFKGGTSLSKAWRLIDRFSEDIDVVIDRDSLGFSGEELSGSRINKLRKKCRKAIQEELKPTLEGRFGELLGKQSAGVLQLASPEEDPDQQTLLFNYPSVFPAAESYIRRVVKIEMGARSDTEPSENPSIQPYLTEAFPELTGPCSFSLRTVAARRTFWEKAMLLHEETFRPQDKPRKARLARHYYDVWCLITKGVAVEAVKESGLFHRVAQHRQVFFGQDWVDYSTLSKGSLRLVPLREQLDEWRSDYAAMRSDMFIGTPPSFDEVLNVVQRFENEFNGK